MRTFFAAAFAVVVGAMLSAQSPPASPTGPQRGPDLFGRGNREAPPASPTGSESGPDLSGRWNRDSASASPGGADSAGWGPRIQIGQSGVTVTVQPTPGKPSRFRLDGKETAEALSVDGCKTTVRITKAVPSRDKVTITTWLVTKAGCVHGEDEDDPFVAHIGVVDPDRVFGRRKLESITDVYREGETLTVQTTRSSLGETTTTTATYRK